MASIMASSFFVVLIPRGKIVDNKRIIGFYGAGQTDICLYLGAIFANLKITVLVVDNSYDQLIKYIIHGKKENGRIKKQGVEYAFMLQQSDLRSESAQIIIVDLGNWPSDDAVYVCDEVYMVTDLNVSKIARYRELIRRLEMPVSVVLRDVCEEAVRSSNILHLLSENNPFIYEEHKLPLNEDDRIEWLLMQYHGFERFKYISGEMEELLSDIVRHNCQVSSQGLAKVIKLAKKGGAL